MRLIGSIIVVYLHENRCKEQEQLKYQTLLAQLKAKGIDITTLE